MNETYFKYLLVLAMMLWGGGWTALKILTQTQSMEVVIFWRFFIMSLAFIPILYFFKQKIILNMMSLKYIFMSSILNIAFMIFSYLGIKEGFAGAGSVIITTLSPIMTFLVMWLFFKKQLSKLQYLGLFLGLIGGFFLLELNDMAAFLDGANLYFLIASLIWAGVTILSQYSHQHIHPIHYSFIISLVATFFSFIYGFEFNLQSVFNEDYNFWIALLYLAILGQTVATTIFFMASGKLGSGVTSSFMFLVPFFALLIASLVLDEYIEFHTILGGLFSMIAIFFINFSNSKKET